MTDATRKKLGTLSCVSLIVNKMIGTGIFSIPATVFHYTNGNIGLLLSLFIIGTIVILCGLITYLDYALNLPFKNGGEKNYLLRVYKRPRGLVGCVYAFQIVLLGFSSGNSYAFGKYILYSLRIENERAVTAVGVCCITFCILLHIKYPNHGTRLFNILGLSKLLILVLIIIAGLVAIPYTENDNFKNVWSYEGNKSPGMYSISVGLLEVIYSFKGWENANYVLNEIADPYHILTIAAPVAVIVTSILYFMVVISYFIVIPKEEILDSGVLVAGVFFKRLFGESIASRVLPLIISMSNLGNVLVVSFAHGHLNKELADSNYLPFSKWFQDINYSLILHWFVTIVVLIGPPSSEIYEFVVNLYIYPGSWINILLALGLIYLKINKDKENWGLAYKEAVSHLEYDDINHSELPEIDQSGDLEYTDSTEDIARRNRGASIGDTDGEVTIDLDEAYSCKPISAPYICILVFLFANLFLALFPFAPPPSSESTIPYWCFPTVGCATLLAGVIFYYIRPYFSKKKENMYVE